MVLNIIFFVSVYPIALLVYYFIRVAGNGKGRYCFGATMKDEWREDEDVKAIIKHFNKCLNWTILIFMLIPITFVFIPYTSISINLWVFWIYAMCVIPLLPIVKANRAFRELKKQKGWNIEEGSEKVYVELKSAGAVRQVKLVWFTIPVVIGAAAVAAAILIGNGRDVTVEVMLTASMALVNVMLLLVALWLDMQKTKVISRDSDVNVNYSRAKKKVWKNYWLECVWSNTAVTAAIPALMALNPEILVGVYVWFSIAECVIVLVFTFVLGRNINKIEQMYRARNELADSSENDDCWIGGILYYNPKDRHTMVSTRVGTGTSINMATGFGKGLVIVCAVILIGSAILTLSVIGEEFTPVHLKVNNEAVVAEHTSREYEIQISDIKDVQLLTEMPSASRKNGTGMDNLLKGDFSVRDNGRCELCLNPQNGAFIRVETESQVYYFSGIDDEETRDVYQTIMDSK